MVGGLYLTAGGAGWARVEAKKHYPTDVLVGFSLGRFIAEFMQGSLLEFGMPVDVDATALSDGATVTLRWHAPFRSR